MKETVFRFELQVDPADANAILQSLNDRLAALKGVLGSESERTDHGTSLAVRVSFGDSEDARKLHRKVMTNVLAHEGVTISQMTTKLTDIF